MNESIDNVEDLSQKDTARLVLDMLHRTIIHYALWFTEVRHQMGLEKAIQTLRGAREKSFGIHMKRLSKILGFEMRDGIPAGLLDMPKDQLLQLLDAVAVNWIATDGSCGSRRWSFPAACSTPSDAMTPAGPISPLLKRIPSNSCSGMTEKPGIDGLEKAFKFRLYTRREHPASFPGGAGHPGLADERLQGPVGAQTQRAGRLPVQIRRGHRVHLFRQGHRPADRHRMRSVSAGRSSRRMVLQLAVSPYGGRTVKLNLLFVCAGNISRSYLAQKLMDHQVRRRSFDGVATASAGVLNLAGRPPDPVMQAFLLEQGVGVADTEHRSRHIGRRDVLWADLILVMEKSHAAEISRRWPDSREKIELLGRFVASDGSADDIADPFGGSDFGYRLAQSKIGLAVEGLAKRLAEAQGKETWDGRTLRIFLRGGHGPMKTPLFLNSTPPHGCIRWCGYLCFELSR